MVRALTGVLRDSAAPVRAAAAHALGGGGRRAAEAFPTLQALLGDADPQVRLAAATALAWGGDRSASVIGTLSALLAAPAAGPTANPVVPLPAQPPLPAWDGASLLGAAWDATSDLTPREEAVLVLGWLGPAAAGAGPTLGRLLDSPAESWRVRELAAGALAAIGLGPLKQMPAFVATLREAVESGRRDAALALAWTGPPDAALQDLLIEALRDTANPAELRVAAMAALGQLNQPTPAILSVLQNVSREPSEVVRAGVLQTIRAWGMVAQSGPGGARP